MVHELYEVGWCASAGELFWCCAWGLTGLGWVGNPGLHPRLLYVALLGPGLWGYLRNAPGFLPVMRLTKFERPAASENPAWPAMLSMEEDFSWRSSMMVSTRDFLITVAGLSELQAAKARSRLLRDTPQALASSVTLMLRSGLELM